MIIWLTGRIAAGKWVVVDYLKEKGFEYFTVSQIVRQEAAKRWVEITRFNLQTIGNEVRKEFGIGEWMKRIIAQMETWKNYIVDGIRNPGEVRELQTQSDFYLLSIDAPESVRFERALLRAKESDPKTKQDFEIIDKRDFGIGEPEDGQQVGKCMQMADFHIFNDGSLQDYQKKIDTIYDRIKK